MYDWGLVMYNRNILHLTGNDPAAGDELNNKVFK